ncbi:hypothetical protein LOK49_LG04G00538 [Camellia lanceoleosa]|uniref:Uncharacterized protein n=1 Tax=Camellia lanceoleosa TaxID=1840588 RepID=A0ACC0I3I1_9ERIC|nr:hypothetical protein LOK49_LG04G00538 [Camellia lanceoleosa]
MNAAMAKEMGEAERGWVKRINHHSPSSQHRTRPVSVNLPPSNIATAAHRPPLLLRLRDLRHPLVLGQLQNPFPMAPLFPPRHPPLSVTSEERLSCLFHLKSSTENTQDEQGSAICLRPGTSDYHVFFPENQGDALLLEVQDTKKTIHGRAIIPIASLTENPNDRIRWWQIYHDDHECVGKVQFSIGSTITSNEISHIKSKGQLLTFPHPTLLKKCMSAT